MKKRILAIVGSPKNINSNTYVVISKLFDLIKGVEYEKFVIPLSEYKINGCKGCANCFVNCNICNQFDDDIKYIENEILKSDFIIFASPVFAHNVSGLIKNFIDRIAYGMHVFRFAGKYGMSVSVSNSNGNKFVNDYIDKILLYFGVKVIDSISVQMVKGVDDKKLLICAEKIINALNVDNYRKTTDYEELVFQTMKKALNIVHLNSDTNETKYWEEHGYFDCESLEEIFKLEKIKKGNNV